MNNVIAGLDIGTSKVRAVIGEIDENGKLEITGIGTSQTTGLRKSVVVNIDSTCKSVRDAVESAELMSGRQIDTCFVSIGGTHIEGLNSRGLAAITGKGGEHREIGDEDIARAVEQACAISIPMDRNMIHVLPRLYRVDNQTGIRNPRNMIGVRLECDVHIITADVNSIQNVIQCVSRAGYHAADHFCLASLAAARAVMTDEERELGAVLIDIGSGTTDVLVFSDGEPCYTTVLGVGGSQVTNDVAIVKSISADIAESIKLDYGCCWRPSLEEGDPILVPGIGGRGPSEMPREELCAIIQCRMEEIFQMVYAEIEDLIKMKPLSGGVIITGGGALLPGVAELAGTIFNMPVRIGYPIAIGGVVSEYSGPDSSAALGLVLYGAQQCLQGGGSAVVTEKNTFDIGKKLVNWLKDLFE